MLQRAANNAYSWWLASNVRTKQSKWLDGDMQEMEGKVKTMLKLIDEDADSFSKKAELYFKRRPELIKYVEDMYRTYKALADRFDRISGELHNANHTIATVFPEQVQFVMQDDDDNGLSKAVASIDPSNIKNSPSKFPHLISTDKNKDGNPAPRRTHHKRTNSELSKEKSQKEIDRLQREILVMQTEKEFVKSSYVTGLAKYWDIEKQINEMQEEICSLQDDFGANAIIEDDEARALMVARAIKSCEDSLVKLQNQQNITSDEVRVESKRIRDAKGKLKALKAEFGHSKNDTAEVTSLGSSTDTAEMEEQSYGLKDKRLELQSICQKVKEQFAVSSETSIVEMAGKINELVDKVIGLELTVSSQIAQIKMLRSETDELQMNLHGLEEDKALLANDSKILIERLKHAEKELQRVQELEKSIQEENGSLHAQLAESCQSFNGLSEKLQSPNYQDQANEVFDSNASKEKGNVNKLVANLEKAENDAKHRAAASRRNSATEFSELGNQLHIQVEELDDTPDLELLLANGVKGKEKILLAKFTQILQKYKDAKERLADFEKNQECHSHTMAQVRELKNSNTMKDEKIRLLTDILDTLQANINANAPESEKFQQKLNLAPESHYAWNDTTNSGHISQPSVPQSIEDKFRADINTVLEENLDYWLRFSTSYQQIQKFETLSKELKAEIQKLNEMKSHDTSGPALNAAVEAVKQESVPIDRRLRTLNTELQVWLEKNTLLKSELQYRFSRLCNIQEEISRATSANDTEDEEFTPYQAAKFQGEVLNMQLENNKVAKELQTGLDHVRSLQTEVGRALLQNQENFDLTVSRIQHNDLKNASTKTRIPLRTFLFGPKLKKSSKFSFINQAHQKQHSDRTSFQT